MMDIEDGECEHGVPLDQWCALCQRDEEHAFLFALLLGVVGCALLLLWIAL